MTISRAALAGLWLTFLAVSAAPAADETAQPYTPQSALAALEMLVGDWANEKAPEAGRTMHIRATGGGSAVMVTFFPGQESEMLSLFHLDGPDRLVHTHYCALQNQPTMQMVKSDRPGVMRFEFVSGTNMDAAKDLHAHNTEIHVLEGGKFKVVVEAWNEGQPSGTQEFTMQRVDAAVAEAAK
jgi:hypothetical protein